MQVIAPKGLLEVGEERMGRVKRGVAVAVDIAKESGDFLGCKVGMVNATNGI